MQTPSDRDRGGLPRRGVLRALVLAPAALAGCAAGRATGAASDGAAAPGGTATDARRGPAPAAVSAVRAFRLPIDAEPASVFRAAAARPGDAR